MTQYSDSLDLMAAGLGLTSQQTGHELTHFILDWIKSWDFVTSALLYEASYLEISASKANNVTLHQFTYSLKDRIKEKVKDTHIAVCAIDKRKISIENSDNETRLIFPVNSRSGPFRIICIDGTQMLPKSRLACFHLVSLYENQINVFDEKERDALTGLLNRQTFDKQLIDILSISSQSNKTKTSNKSYLALFDIDHFKKVNDTYGHLIGDEVLLQFAQIMDLNFRYSDFLYRYGGEEFIVLINNISLEQVIKILERFRKRIEKNIFPTVGKVTVSIGFIEIVKNVLPTSLVDRADQALYYAKENGRNKLIFYDDINKSDNIYDSDDIELF